MISYAYRSASGKNAELIPHIDPTDHFYSNDIFEKRKKKKTTFEESSEDQKDEPAYEIPNKKRKSNLIHEDTETRKNFSVKDGNIIEDLGFRKEQCTPDGNCFFRTLEFFTKESYRHLRQAIVTSMRVNENLYTQLFTKTNQLKYFIGESTLKERCHLMSINKTWAGFPEKLGTALFIGKNIFELCQNNSNSHWNVYIGTSEARSLDQNYIPNIYIHLDVAGRHFSPLTIQTSTAIKVEISNLYYLIKDQDGDGVFIEMKPYELSPNHEFFENMVNEQFKEQPVGLRNVQNSCYFNSLFQCIHSVPQMWNAFEIDQMHTQNLGSFVGSICELLQSLHNTESLDILQDKCEVIMRKIRGRYPNRYPVGNHEDPQELFLDLLSIVNEEQTQDIRKSADQNISNLVQTVHYHQDMQRSNTTKLISSYTKTIRYMHSKCQQISYEGVNFLALPFSQKSTASASIESLFTLFTQLTDEGKIDKCSICELQNINMSQQISMEHLPEILIISLLR